MIIKFKDGHKIKFKRYGEIWLSESVIWEDTNLHGSLEDLRVLKAVIAKWFAKNALEEFADRFTARLPMWGEIKNLPFQDQIAYKEGTINQVSVYLLGDESNDYPAYCNIGHSDGAYGWFYCYAYLGWSGSSAVRLCLEDKK